MIAEDPLLADTKIIAEAWDAAGAYQVGSFAAMRWAEWNGRYRDDVRRFWRGDPHMRGALATRIAGSSDLYEWSGRSPYHSINFVTAHDGFTLNDLVSYNEKHNEANSEGNRDGDNNNCSYNYGFEGPSSRKSIERLRQRQIKNMLATLFLSQGVPMLLAGDECRRTQLGNNNAWCQDNEISWFDWNLLEQNEELVRFTRSVIELRKNNPTLRRTHFLSGLPAGQGKLPEVGWFNHWGGQVDWGSGDKTLACLLGSPPADCWGVGREVLLMFNAETYDQDFWIPLPARAFAWRRLLDTAARSPRDVYAEGEGPIVDASRAVRVETRSLVALVADQCNRR
jgi:glycogen operon protein